MHKNAVVAGAALAAGLGYGMGCWLARATAYATRVETAELARRRPAAPGWITAGVPPG